MITSRTARRAVARERRHGATGVAACQGLPPPAMPPATEGNGDEGLVSGGGGSEVGPSKKDATAGGEMGCGSARSRSAGPIWDGTAAMAGIGNDATAGEEAGGSRLTAGGGVRRNPEVAARGT